jgi:membrane-bound lytic murein transglycosylase D
MFKLLQKMTKYKLAATMSTVIIIAFLLINAGVDRRYDPKNRYYPKAVDFAGEPAPLQIDDVRERFERELIVNANLEATTVLIIKRAARVFPIIEPILKQYNIPDDFKYLAVIESGLVHAVSPAGARGIWQFMPETAKEFNMEVSETVDERYHLERATVAACKYLLKSREHFGSWTLAAAAYNGGQGGVRKQLDFQGVSNYYDVMLTEETARYVFRILALKEIMQNPEQYGFKLHPDELYATMPVRKVTVDSSISNLAQFAKSQGINYKILKIHNPWLRDKKLVNLNKKKYLIDIPTQGY